MKLFDYDDRNERSIFNYAKRLEGRTFNDVLESFKSSPKKFYSNPYEYDFSSISSGVKEDTATYENMNTAKGQLGNFLERYYFGYFPNSEQDADFKKVGIELKQTCVDVKKNGEYTAGERLSITNISYDEPVEEDFYKSHVWKKTSHILLIHYLRDKCINRLDYQILFVNLFTPPKKDLKIIIDDYNKINEKIKKGVAHELSESDTLYLGACTKGATAKKSLKSQYYGSELAKARNFCFKRQYMDYVLHHYILKNNVPYESIVSNNQDIGDNTFEEYVQSRINSYVGKTGRELCRIFSKEYNENKAQWNTLAYKMLGINGNHAEEFVKANIKVKTIRLDENNHMKESMSFPSFLFKELVQEEWEDSTIHNYFDETRFLFVTFKYDGNEYILKGCQMWNMPYDDLNTVVRHGWENIQRVIKSGVEFTIKENGINNNLPKKSDNPIIHIRPHAKKSAYKLSNGYISGNFERDANELPNGDWMTTQSFWINNSYILSQLKIK